MRTVTAECEDTVPLMHADGAVCQFRVRVQGKVFQCECGCRVFHKPDEQNLDRYECNDCSQQFDSEKQR